MNFDSISDQASFDSNDQTTLYDHLNKTKTQPTKFFTDLNKHQKILTKKMRTSKQNQKKPCSNKKNKNKSPTFKQMIMASRKYLDDQQNNYKNSKVEVSSKKKVRFDNRQSLQQKDKRKPSIQINVNGFNFYESIKQMALVLSQSKKSCQDQIQKSSHHQNTNDSLFSGYTEKQFQDGTKFKGLCQNGVIIKGQLQFSNGYVYDGEFFLDKFHGKGKLTLPKKQIIEADWIDGQIVGKATIKYPKGQIYYGDIKHLRRHGKGHLFFNDGSKYEGQFNQGQLTGYGVHITTSGQKTSGYWFYGDFVGTNQQVFQNIINNVAAHQKKKSQKANKQIQFLKRRSQRNQREHVDLFEQLLRTTMIQ